MIRPQYNYPPASKIPMGIGRHPHKPDDNQHPVPSRLIGVIGAIVVMMALALSLSALVVLIIYGHG